MFQRGLAPPDPFRDQGALAAIKTQDGMSLQTMVEMGRVVVVLLPPVGSGARRRWLEAMREARAELESAGYRVLLVHEDAEPDFAPFELKYVARARDADAALYAHFELGEAKRFVVVGAPRQLPGVAWYEDGELKRVDRAASFGDSPSLRPSL